MGEKARRREIDGLDGLDGMGWQDRTAPQITGAIGRRGRAAGRAAGRAGAWHDHPDSPDDPDYTQTTQTTQTSQSTTQPAGLAARARVAGIGRTQQRPTRSMEAGQRVCSTAGGPRRARGQGRGRAGGRGWRARVVLFARFKGSRSARPCSAGTARAQTRPIWRSWSAAAVPKHSTANRAACCCARGAAVLRAASCKPARACLRPVYHADWEPEMLVQRRRPRRTHAPSQTPQAARSSCFICCSISIRLPVCCSCS